jgi:hypothetical protein
MTFRMPSHRNRTPKAMRNPRSDACGSHSTAGGDAPAIPIADGRYEGVVYPASAPRRARSGCGPTYLSRSPERTACAAASRATGTRNGEHDT